MKTFMMMIILGFSLGLAAETREEGSDPSHKERDYSTTQTSSEGRRTQGTQITDQDLSQIKNPCDVVPMLQSQ